MQRIPILLVDDEPINLAAMEAVLTHDYQLYFAKTGTDAITAALRHLPALILLDVQMPGMNGYAVCRQLKADPRTESIPVIFVTGLTDAGHEEEGFSCGGVDYIAKPVSAPLLRARVKTHLSLVRASTLDRSYRDAIHMLGEAGHYNDADTGVHIWRMAAYAGAIAAAYGLPPEQCALIELAAPMHDTGKIGVPNAVLKKPGKLNPEEWAQMQQHCQMGYDILAKSQAPIFQLAAHIALHHHEHWDGSGYPHQLRGTDIPLAARIVALADVFDALSMKRPYKEAWPVEVAIESVRAQSGSHFDPDVVRAFEAILPRILEICQQWIAHDVHGQSAQTGSALHGAPAR